MSGEDQNLPITPTYQGKQIPIISNVAIADRGGVGAGKVRGWWRRKSRVGWGGGVERMGRKAKGGRKEGEEVMMGWVREAQNR